MSVARSTPTPGCKQQRRWHSQALARIALQLWGDACTPASRLVAQHLKCCRAGLAACFGRIGHPTLTAPVPSHHPGRHQRGTRRCRRTRAQYCTHEPAIVLRTLSPASCLPTTCLPASRCAPWRRRPRAMRTSQRRRHVVAPWRQSRHPWPNRRRRRHRHHQQRHRPPHLPRRPPPPQQDQQRFACLTCRPASRTHYRAPCSYTAAQSRQPVRHPHRWQRECLCRRRQLRLRPGARAVRTTRMTVAMT